MGATSAPMSLQRQIAEPRLLAAGSGWTVQRRGNGIVHIQLHYELGGETMKRSDELFDAAIALTFAAYLQSRSMTVWTKPEA
jgi:hypothetical protein